MTTAEKDLSHRADVATRLLDSSDQLSYDPVREVDWDSPVDPLHHGASPEWSTLYGTSYWDEMTEEQRAALTRQEAASVASTGIWFEMILQQMVHPGLLREGPDRPRVPVGAHRDRRRVPALDHVRARRAEARRAGVPPAAARRRARPRVQDPRPGRGRLRRDPRRRGGPRRHAARLDARRAGRPVRRARSTTSTSSKSRGTCSFAREETRERLQGAGAARRQFNALVVAVAGLPHRHEHGERQGLRERRPRPEAGEARGEAPTNTTGPCCGRAAPGSWSSSTPRACSPRRPRRSTSARNLI